MATTSASIQMMKIAIQENESELANLINELTNPFSSLCLDAESHICEELKSGLKSKI